MREWPAVREERMTERTIPILPCRSIDEVLAFYRALGFVVIYQQERPNTYAVVARGGIELQFYVMKGFDPDGSYGSCYVLVSDVDALYEAFRSGLRA
jgi:catechol 2,3-dioxygenase-like lactoylglutathione lyase family enzyme